MNQSASQSQIEDQIQTEIALKRAREEAAARETVGVRKFVSIVRAIGWCGALVPIVGFLAIGLGTFLAFWGSVYVAVKGDHTGGFKQIVITVLGGIAAFIVWFILNILVVTIFG